MGGKVTCTLGEVANRGDLIIFWGGNPAESHPRHFSKYSLMPKGMFVPNGRKDRTAVGVDVRKTKTAKAMDLFFQIKPRSDFEALWTLRALAKGIEVPCFSLTGPTSGSDAATMRDVGYVTRGMHEGKDVVGIRLNWDKRYITLGPKATLVGLAFRLLDPQQILGRGEEIGDMVPEAVARAIESAGLYR